MPIPPPFTLEELQVMMSFLQRSQIVGSESEQMTILKQKIIRMSQTYEENQHAKETKTENEQDGRKDQGE